MRGAELQKALSCNSQLEACIRIWTLGDYFCVDRLRSYGLYSLSFRCQDLLNKVSEVSAMVKGIPFLDDLEAGIRAAWHLDRMTEPTKASLMQLCCRLSPYLWKHQSFINLLDEAPDFAVDLAKALLGCTRVGPCSSSEEAGLVGRCHRKGCSKLIRKILPGDQDDASLGAVEFEGIHYITRTSMALNASQGALYCSSECLKTTRSKASSQKK